MKNGQFHFILDLEIMMGKSVASCPKRLWRVVQGYCGGLSRVLWRDVHGIVAGCLGAGCLCGELSGIRFKTEAR